MDSDQDAEGEEDTDLYQLDQELQSAVQKADAGSAIEEEEPTAESDAAEDDDKSEEGDYSEQVNDDAVSRESENEYDETPRRPRRARRSAAISSKSDEESDPDVAYGNGDARSDSDRKVMHRTERQKIGRQKVMQTMKMTQTSWFGRIACEFAMLQ